MNTSPEALAAAMNWLKYSGRELGLDSQLLLRLQLVAEELLLNTLLHGSCPANEVEIDLKLEVELDQICLVYTDQAQAFNPLHALPATAPEAMHVGLTLIRQIPKYVNYQQLPTGNQLCLHFQTDQPRH